MNEFSQAQLTSSDSHRSASALRYARSATFDEPLELELGARLPSVTVAYETYGELSPARDNAVLICHALSGDSHVARHTGHDDPGWWEAMVGPGKAIDTGRCFVICPNVLGGCRGTTGPGSINPATHRRYAAQFPPITVADTVDVQRRLIDSLGIENLMAVIGGSMGGQQAIAWAVRYPQRVRDCIAIATSSRLTSQALAFDVIGRNAIRSDPNFNGGDYYDLPQRPFVGLALARMIAHVTYLSHDAMATKFDVNRTQPHSITTQFEKCFSVGSYLAYQADRFVERFDANSYLVLSLMMDQFDLERAGTLLRKSLAPAQCRWLVISFTSDWLFPPAQSQQIVDALRENAQPVSYLNVPTSSGHDAFLLPDSLDLYGEHVRNFLQGV
ncbi:MAG TPA: homoserine O-acetyltransferase [Tepidisphaeraceae bacterium]|nr:homoserine O-acetyltransferase [Tepidisphaeraceae bacterium]